MKIKSIILEQGEKKPVNCGECYKFMAVIKVDGKDVPRCNAKEILLPDGCVITMKQPIVSIYKDCPIQEQHPEQPDMSKYELVDEVEDCKHKDGYCCFTHPTYNCQRGNLQCCEGKCYRLKPTQS